MRGDGMSREGESVSKQGAGLAERASKIIVLGSALVALVAQTAIALGWPGLWLVVGLSLAAAWILGRCAWAWAAWPILGAAFITPALLHLLAAPFFYPYAVIWFAAVLGLVLASPAATRWSVPHTWRAPLGCWGLVVALSWPIVAGRELDWNLPFAFSFITQVSGTGVPARAAAEWITFVALTHLAGLLWLDSLFAALPDETAFRRNVIAPLALSWCLAELVGVYQLTVDMRAFNPGMWMALKRATGPLFEANGFGMISAMWGAVFAAVLFSRRTPASYGAAAGCAVLSWMGVWGSGSRNAFAMAAVTWTAVLIGVLRAPAFRHLRARILTGVTVMAAVSTVAVLTLDLPVIGPIRRIWEFVPNRTFGEFLYQFWDRAQYGSAGVEAFRRSPLVGIGIGSFQHLVADIWYSHGYVRLPPDNAQSWYRHELAELGLLGSVGWIVWLTMVSIAVLRRANGTDPLVTAAIKTVLITLGLIELVGIPTQVFPVAFSFLTMLAWHVRQSSVQVTDGTAWNARRWLWALVWMLAATHAVVTAVEARGAWRVPHRAVWGKFDYEYGFRHNADSAESTMRHAVLVRAAETGWLKLTVWVEHADADVRPVRVGVWFNGDHIVNRRLRRNVRVTEYVRTEPGSRFVLEAKVERTFSRDGLERGLELRWEFVDRAPGGH